MNIFLGVCGIDSVMEIYVASCLQPIGNHMVLEFQVLQVEGSVLKMMCATVGYYRIVLNTVESVRQMYIEWSLV